MWIAMVHDTAAASVAMPYYVYVGIWESLLSLDPMNGSHVALYGCGQTTRESLRI